VANDSGYLLDNQQAEAGTRFDALATLFNPSTFGTSRRSGSQKAGGVGKSQNTAAAFHPARFVAPAFSTWSTRSTRSSSRPPSAWTRKHH